MNKIRFYIWNAWPLMIAIVLINFCGVARDLSLIGKGTMMAMVITAIVAVIGQIALWIFRNESEVGNTYDSYIAQRAKNYNVSVKLKTQKGSLSRAE